MEKEELRNRALSIVQIPGDFQAIIEEYAEGENGEGEAMFVWINEESDEGITINLDLEGNLIHLTIDLNDQDANEIPLNVEERKVRAERFFLSHYPGALEELTFYEMKKMDHTYRYYYEKIVMDLPLNSAGCYIDVDPSGNIVNFSYKAVKKIPEIPRTLISKEKLIEHVQNSLDFQLTIKNLYTIIYNVAEDGFRLVYEPEESFMKFKADVLTPTLSIIHDEDVPETFVPLPPPSNTVSQKDIPINEVVGITEEMDIIREVDMGEETGIVWRDRNWEMEEDLSMEGYFKRQTEDTVKAFISKETGRVRSFMWFNERSGNLQLSHEECYQKAINFLQLNIPDYHKYLQLIVRENEEDEQDEARNTEVFTFTMHNSDGIPVQSEIVVVTVNNKTGHIDHYSGPSFDMEKLSQIPTKTSISKQEARDIFLKHLDFELAWETDYDGDIESYFLVYQACDRYSRTPIRYIDAMTGAVITARDK